MRIWPRKKSKELTLEEQIKKEGWYKQPAKPAESKIWVLMKRDLLASEDGIHEKYLRKDGLYQIKESLAVALIAQGIATRKTGVV